MRLWSLARRELLSAFDLSIAAVVLSAFVVLTSVYVFVLNPFFVQSQATVRPLFEFVPFLFTLFIPSITMRALAEERRSGHLDVLLSWPVSDWEIAAGKWLGAWLFVGVGLAGTAAVPLAVAALGPLDWGPVIGGYLGLWLLGGAYLAVSLFLSALTDNPIVAFVGGFVACFVLYAVGRLAPILPDGIAPIATFLGFEGRIARIARGVLDARDVAYFVSVALLGIGATAELLGSRRWR